MEEILARQVDQPKPMTGKGFLLSVMTIVLKLACAQLICNLLILASGKGLFNILFYLYALLLIMKFMRKAVAGYVYTLKENTLILERKLGDSTTSVVEIPLKSIVCCRTARQGENQKIYYKQVTVIDPAAGPSLQMKIAFGLSLISAHLARKIAGKKPHKVCGRVVVFREGLNLRACLFRPNEAFEKAFLEAEGKNLVPDDRLTREPVDTFYARALERAFPDLYGFVDPLVSPEDVEWADEELARRKKAREEEKAAREEEKAAREKAPKGKKKAPQKKTEKNTDGSPARRRRQE